MPDIEAETEWEGRGSRWNTKGLHHPHVPFPKLEFPYFNGEEPWEWLTNCEQYFKVYQIPQPQWVGIATMHLNGRARSWKQSYFLSKPRVTWEDFAKALCKRFAHIGERYLVREFSNLKQTGTVERCPDRFEELKTQLLGYNPYLTEEHLIACYINGLKDELVSFIDIAHPSTLEEAYEQATLHEKTLTVMSKKLRGNYKPVTQYSQTTSVKPSRGASVYQQQSTINRAKAGS